MIDLSSLITDDATKYHYAVRIYRTFTLVVCFSCCHRWNWIFWSCGLPDSCLLRSYLPQQVMFCFKPV